MTTDRPGEDPPSAAGFGLPRSARLLSQRDFRRVYGRGRRAHGRLLVVVGLSRREAGGHRLGLAVSKEHGGAVRRNKFKRILREAFRLERPRLPGRFDLVLIPRPNDGAHLELPEVRVELQRLVSKLLEPRTGADRGGRGRDRRGNRRRRGGPGGGGGRGKHSSGGPK